MKKGRAAKFYKLTPKAYRYLIALSEFEHRLRELEVMSDERIMEIFDGKKHENPSLRNNSPTDKFPIKYTELIRGLLKSDMVKDIIKYDYGVELK